MKGRIAVVLAAMAVAGLAGAQKPDDRTQIKALYDSAKQAYQRRDANAIIAMSTPDFTAKGPGGKLITTAQTRQILQTQFKLLQSVTSCTVNPGKIAVLGNTANVITNYSISGTFVDKGGRMGPAGQTHTVTFSSRSTDTLVKGTSGWRIKEMDATMSSVFLDGKALDVNRAPHKR